MILMSDATYDPVAEMVEQAAIHEALDKIPEGDPVPQYIAAEVTNLFIDLNANVTTEMREFWEEHDQLYDEDHPQTVLLILAAAIEKGILPIGFNMGVYAINASANSVQEPPFTDKSGRNHGDVADIGGWFAALFTILGTPRPRPLIIGEIEALAERANLVDYVKLATLIDEDRVMELIAPHVDPAIVIDPRAFTAEQAVRVLRTFVATGEVTWVKEWLAMPVESSFQVAIDPGTKNKTIIGVDYGSGDKSAPADGSGAFVAAVHYPKGA